MNLNPLTQINLFECKEIFNQLCKLYKNDTLPNKILLSGEKGIGKSTLAHHLINYILSLNEEFSYDRKNYEINEQNKSYKLIQNQTNLNFHLIDIVKDKKNIDINQIRDLIFDLNKSSFNSKPRFVLIDNIELLNINSINALLKILEEPNKNIIFILINNNKKILPTLKSRCLNYKVFISYDETIEIINKVLDADIFELINKELINYYTTPGQLYEMVKFSNYQKINLKDMSLKEFLSQIIQSKAFKKEKSINEILFNLIELYLRKKTSIKNVYLIDLYKYFLKRINDVKIYNLDTESLYMEFEDKILNG